MISLYIIKYGVPRTPCPGVYYNELSILYNKEDLPYIEAVFFNVFHEGWGRHKEHAHRHFIVVAGD
jgi:hypothetical protein